MAKGSVADHLYRRPTIPLSWGVRVNILYEAACGLAFLHTRKRGVIHGNIKTSNILLDSNYNAKLSHPIPDDLQSEAMGMCGYAAPEYVATGHRFAAGDVYGFGVVLLELLSGRRVIDDARPASERDLLHWAKPYLSDRRKLYRVMDLRLKGQYSSIGAKLALDCLSNSPTTRPSMIYVMEALEGIQSIPGNTRESKRSSP